MPAPIRILIVDDSAFVRKCVREMLSHNPAFEVAGFARDGNEALEKAEELKPDVITCDLIMPALDGVGFVRRQMARRPIPILVLTASPEEAGRIMEALEAGAVDFIQKPNGRASSELFSVRDELLAKVLAAAPSSAETPRLNLKQPAPPAVLAPPPPPCLPSRAPKIELVVLGVSTGGPQALRRLLPQFPRDFPVPLAIVIHMPIGYTAMFAEHLNRECQILVREARDGDPLKPGEACLGQAGQHLLIQRGVGGSLQARLSRVSSSPKSLHRPSVDSLFESAAAACKSRVLAVVMTGMGEDGKLGAARIKAGGGTVFTEAKESCVIFGMPRAVMEGGWSDAAYPLSSMAEAIAKHL